MSADRPDLGITRIRDVLAVVVVAGIIGYAITRFNYSKMPQMPRLAGLAPVIIGLAEGATGLGLRRRIRHAERGEVTPVPPLTAARMLQLAKASALAGGALFGLWAGMTAYVAALSGSVQAAADDTVSGIVGLVGSVVMICGAIFLELSCRVPDRPQRQ